MKIAPIFFCSLLLAAPLVRAQETYGTIRATTKLREDGSKSTTIVDPEKRTAEETITDSGNKVLRKTTYLLGDHDLAVGAIFYNAKGVAIYQASYQRDAQGHVVESSFTSPDGRYLGKRLFVYGAKDAVSQVQDYDANGVLITSAAKPGAASTSSGRKRR